MRAYLDLFDTTIINDVDEQMCWECWPEDEGPDMLDDSF
jgi:hypothetical protein